MSGDAAHSSYGECAIRWRSGARSGEGRLVIPPPEREAGLCLVEQFARVTERLSALRWWYRATPAGKSVLAFSRG